MIFFPEGTVAPDADYERVCEAVTAELTALRDPRTGQSVIPRVYRAGEIYHGDHLADAPDLILGWWEGRTFTSARSHPRFANEQAVFYPPCKAIPGQDITGIHRRDGVLVASGPQVSGSSGQRAAELVDIAPTALALLGLTAPADMDGQVLKDIVAAQIPAGPAPRRSSDGLAPDSERPGEGRMTRYSDRERKIIEDRLSGLGYIE